MLYKLFSSSRLALTLLLVFAVAMAAATFVENDFGTAAAWILIYDSWWFELVMLGLALSFIANIFKYRLLQSRKWAILLFHIAFVVIIIGAGITRYSSYSGIIRIREGASSNLMITDKNYLQVEINDKESKKHLEKALNFSTLKNNDFTIKTDFKGTPIHISYHQFIPDAVPTIFHDSINGEPILELVISHGSEKQTVFLKKGEIESVDNHHQIEFQTQNPSPENVSIIEKEGQLFVKAPNNLDYFMMSTQAAGVFQKDSLHPFHLKTLYRMGDLSFVPNKYHPSGKIDFMSTAENSKDNDKVKDDVLLINVSIHNKQQQVPILYREGFLPSVHPLSSENLDLTFSYGAKPFLLPFSVKLNDFQLERYPGSSSPSSYASEVTVVDKDESFDFRIFMNNVLDHKGYRFFQASYDTDEKGTVLSVNYDHLGTNITYLGYFLMTLGMFFTFFSKASRFKMLSKKLKKLKQKQALPLLLLALFSVTNIEAQQNTKPFIEPVNELHAEYFGRLLVQDLDGRIKPINTLASEFLRKLSRKNYLIISDSIQEYRLTPDQVFLGIHMLPNYWQNVPIIKIDKEKGGEIFQDVIPNQNSLISFQQLLTPSGDYLLSKAVEEVNLKKPAERNESDKEILKVDERFNIFYNILIGNYLKIFPKKNDPNNTWYSYTHHFNDFSEEDRSFAKSVLPVYFKDIATKNWKSANEKVSYIETYQKVLAKDVIPSNNQIEAEIWYNKINLNFWLFQILFTAGFILLIIAIAKIFTNSKLLTFLWNCLVLISLISFIVFTANLILRWYIAEHAPWSNGYEMLVFVAWCLLLSGILTFRKSDFTLPLATLFAGALLFVSYLDWLNPEITNLMPVLKSYWLKIHVATIVSSYAPLALSAVLGIMSLILMLIKNSRNHIAVESRIKELTYINEMSMTIGLFVLAVGTFLGGVWANESWGRYWAWDPKETWALISIIIYAIVLHLRFIPKLNNQFVLNTASIFAFWSIIMTSFGVNYYLTGLHSYATGDPIPIPKFIYVLLGIQLAITLLSGLKLTMRKA